MAKHTKAARAAVILGLAIGVSGLAHAEAAVEETSKVSKVSELIVVDEDGRITFDEVVSDDAIDELLTITGESKDILDVEQYADINAYCPTNHKCTVTNNCGGGGGGNGGGSGPVITAA